MVGRLIKDILLLAKVRSSKLIITAGMPRSGSTLLFNMVRLAVLAEPKSQKEERLSSGWISEILEMPDASAYLVKTHRLSRLMTMKSNSIFYSYRDVRDALVSNYRKFDKSPSIEIVREWIRQYSIAKSKSVKMLKYEDMIKDLRSQIIEISNTLSKELSDETINSLVYELNSMADRSSLDGEKRFSSDTLLHKNHITGTRSGEWQTLFDKELINDIHKEFDWWFSENQYPIW